MEGNTELAKITVPRYGGAFNQKSVTIENLSDEEYDFVLGAMKTGNFYIRVVNGRLEYVSSYNELPAPTDDEGMLPFWRKISPSEGLITYDLFENEPPYPVLSADSHPSISIRHLCAYSYTPEGYKEEAEKLTSFGFECMRSKRANDGKYWETWFLPSIAFAKGDLRKRITTEKDENKKFTVAIEFLRYNVSFGALDVSIQRLVAQMSE